MILDKLENAVLYFGLSKHLQEGLNYLLSTDFEKLAPGKYFLDGENLIANMNEYETKSEAECKLESHLKYIDIQYLVEGEEMIGYLCKGDQQPTEAYNPDKDVQFYKEKTTFFKLEKGQFVIFFPTDLHQPGIMVSEPVNARKVVLKVAV
jgi:YhcH/YjgK/YiaL family protein